MLAVKVTLGPKGRKVIVDKSYGPPRITKDGVTVAKEIELEDKFENMGAQMVREVASKTSDNAGDGTTTATVLTASIMKEGLKLVAAGMNPMDLKRGIDLAAAAVVKDIERRAEEGAVLRRDRPSRHDLRERGQIGRQDDRRRDEKGRQRGRDHGRRGEDRCDRTRCGRGHSDRGYLSPYFVTNAEKMLAELEEPYISSHPREEAPLYPAELVLVGSTACWIGARSSNPVQIDVISCSENRTASIRPRSAKRNCGILPYRVARSSAVRGEDNSPRSATASAGPATPPCRRAKWMD